MKKPSKKIAKLDPRMLQKPKYKSFRLHKRIRAYQPKLPSTLSIVKKSFSVIGNNKKLFLGIGIVYIFVILVLVHGFNSGLDLKSIKGALGEVYKGKSGSVLSVATLFGVLVSNTSGGSVSGDTSGAVNGTANVYQNLLTIMIALVFIWSLRQVSAGKKVTVRDALYKSLTPFIPFLLVLMIIGLQLLPVGIAGWLYGAVIVKGLAVTFLEKTLWFLVLLLLGIFSFYMITSSIFATFIVTLNDMTPLRAVRSARQLVVHRRLMVIRKFFIYLIYLFLTVLILMVPFIVFLTGAAEWAFFVISTLAWLFTIIYLYMLYRELLNE